MLVFLRQRRWARSTMAAEEAGFTLIEMLVTMLIISILAAFAFPLFADQAAKARDAGAKEIAHAAEVAVESCRLESSGLYTGCNVEALRELDPSLPKSPKLKVTAKGTSYTIAVQSEPKTQVYEVKRAVSGALTFPCKKKALAGCPASGSWE